METPSSPGASELFFTDGTLPLGTKPGTDGYVLTYDSGTGTIRGEAPAAAGIAGSTGGVDDALLRANGTGGATVQSSTATLSDAGLLTVGELSLTTDLAVTHGGTGAGTAAGARNNIVWSGAGVIDPASPYTVVAGVTTITLGSSKTVALPALSTYADGQGLRVINSSASAITVTLDPDGTETIDGGAAGVAAAYTVAARGSVGAVRLSATAWGSVQSGPVDVIRGRIYLSGGAWYGVGEGVLNGAYLAVTTPVALTALRADAGVSLSGADATILSGATTILRADIQPGAWYIALASMGLSAASRLCTVSVAGTATTLPAVDYATLGAGTLSAAWLTQAQTQGMIGWWHEVTRKGKYAATTGNLTTINSANFEVVLLSVPSFGSNGGMAGGRLSDNSANATSVAVASSSNQTTHVGVFLGAIGGTTGADATWVAPQFVVQVSGS